MNECLRPVDLDAVLFDLWVGVLAEHLSGELRNAASGHCLRLSDLPRLVLERLAKDLTEAAIANVEVYFVDRDSGPEPWRVGVHKVVERRNAEEGVVLALFPPDLQLAAGDSVDISTFRAVSMADVELRVERELKRQLPEPLEQAASAVIKYLQFHKWPLPASSRIRYFASIAGQQEDGPAVAGGALYALGLVPDFALLDKPEELHYRLGQHNLPAVNCLRDESYTVIERVMRLPLPDCAATQELREHLLALFKDHRPQDVQEWGKIVATDAGWRHLSLDNWPLGEERQRVDIRLDIEPLKLPRRKDDGVLLFDPNVKVAVSWVTTPRPLDVPGLEYFRLELLSSDRVVVWESPLIKRGTGASSRRSRTIKHADLASLDSGVYFFRVIALDSAGDPFPPQELRDPGEREDAKRINESEDFLLLSSPGELEEHGEIERVSNIVVSGYAEAEIRARCAAVGDGRGPDTVRAQSVQWDTPLDASGETAVATINFDLQRRYTVRLSQRLRKLEGVILDNPDVGGCYRLRLGGQAGEPESETLSLPEELGQVRTRLFAAIREASVQDGAESGSHGRAVCALIDLHPIGQLIEDHARAYLAWLKTNDSDALRLDSVSVDIPEYGPAVLISPTHPLRLLWLLQELSLGRSWSSRRQSGERPEIDIVDTWRRQLSPQGLPGTFTSGPQTGYLDVGPLPGGWEVYLPVHIKDSRAVLSLLRHRLGSGAAHESEADVPPQLIASRLAAFLHQHPYTPALIINVINPGDAALVVDALTELENSHFEDFPDVRYHVRLLTDDPAREGVGRAFRELLDPDRQISEAADRLVKPGTSFLFPKLSWSRASVWEFRDDPERFPAHITLLLDPFFVELRVARKDREDRTSFVHGLIQDAPRRYSGGEHSYRWVRLPAPRPCPDIHGASGRSGLIAEVLEAVGTLQAQLLAPNTDVSGAVAVASLDLDAKDQSLLYAAHAVSTWVLTVDSHLGLEYFDAAGSSDRPGYLLDFTPEFVAVGGKQLLLTTRVGEEVVRLMRPASLQLNLEADDAGAQMLVEALRSLSGRLVLQVMSSPTQVQGALGMALSRLFLGGYDLISESIVIPLDAHPELTTPEQEAAPRLRGDILVVSADAARRHLDFLVIEAKCLAGSGLDEGTKEGILGQLDNSVRVLKERFDPDHWDPDRIDRVVQCWRLSSVLRFYLERALRYGLVAESTSRALRAFFADLDHGYTLSIRKTGLVFRPESTETKLDRSVPGLPIWVVGRNEIQRLVAEALREFGKPPISDGAVEPTNQPKQPAMRGQTTWPDVRRTFLGTRRPQDAAPVSSQEGSASGVSGEVRDVQIGEMGAPGGSREPQEPSEEQALVEGSDRAECSAGGGSSPGSSLDEAQPPESDLAEQVPTPHDGADYDVLLGDTRPSPQYGLVGAVAAEPWRKVALDLNGCNTISVFGVQGSGKSYSVGSILEMATLPIPGISVLPRPLGAVVFHYHQTQDYPPEFISMNQPNDDPHEVQALAEWGASPLPLEDILVITTADTLLLRQREFAGVRVEPIAFASSELTVADWRFLMGATGNDALYLKLVNEAMRQCRDDLTLDKIRCSLQNAPLNDSHRALAETRLDFAARFIDDSRSLRSLLCSGRLVVVDLRDEFVEREQALGLFVTMLNVFSGAGMGGDSFNKLIVFDEAHKYMGGSLIGHVVEVIREMRHKGVTAVIASQDPINVPQAIIELSSAVVLHRFNSPNWLRHIQRSLSALGDMTPAMLASLQPGEAFVWANKSTDPTFTRRAAKVRMRPRVTKHGGSTRTAL